MGLSEHYVDEYINASYNDMKFNIQKDKYISDKYYEIYGCIFGCTK